MTKIYESKQIATTKYVLCIVGAMCVSQMFPYIAAADWFDTAAVKTNLIDATYGLVSQNLGFIAFAVGGATTFLARGGDMWQKGMAFGAGSIGTAGAIKLAEAMLDLG